MRIYTIHIPPGHIHPGSHAEDGNAVLIREGFSWPALLFGPVWAVALGLWAVALGLVAALALLGFGLDLAGADVWSQAAISVGFQVLVGFSAGDLRRWTLARRGWAEAGPVAAPDRLAAEHRYYTSPSPP